MAKFVFNGIVLSENNYIENLMIKRLTSKYGNTDRTLSVQEFLSELDNANLTNSLDSTILILKKFGYNISNPKMLEKVKPYLIKCTGKSILLLNQQIKNSKINKASFYRAAKAYTANKQINETKIDTRKFYDDCNYLINYLTNAILCGEIIYLAESSTIKTLQEQQLELEKETVSVVDGFVKDRLNLAAILNADSPEEMATVLKQYKIKGTEKKK